MSAPLPPGYPRIESHDVMPTRLEDVYQLTTAEERDRLATAYALRDLHRSLRRVVHTLDARLDAMEKRQ
jgi:hypothetical protein